MRLPLRMSGRKQFRNPLNYKAAVPIVNDRREIVGWTDTPPLLRGGTICHDEAEALVGTLIAQYVQINDHEAAIRAGAPQDWRGPWRCLALCSDRIPPVSPLTVASLLASAVRNRVKTVA